jgi:hypothetical protein
MPQAQAARQPCAPGPCSPDILPGRSRTPCVAHAFVLLARSSPLRVGTSHGCQCSMYCIPKTCKNFSYLSFINERRQCRCKQQGEGAHACVSVQRVPKGAGDRGRSWGLRMAPRL